MGTILIATGNRNFNYVMQRELLDEAYAVQCVTDGITAVGCVIEDPAYDVVLLDTAVTGIEGPDAIWLIKKANPDVCVIAITSGTVIGERESSLNAGASVCFEKPFLVNAVKDYLRDRRSPARGWDRRSLWPEQVW